MTVRAGGSRREGEREREGGVLVQVSTFMWI
jgi:hypothetical protein